MYADCHLENSPQVPKVAATNIFHLPRCTLFQLGWIRLISYQRKCWQNRGRTQSPSLQNGKLPWHVSSHPNVRQLIAGFSVSTVYKLTVCKHWVIQCGWLRGKMQNTAIVHTCLRNRKAMRGRQREKKQNNRFFLVKKENKKELKWLYLIISKFR